MPREKRATIEVQGTAITVLTIREEDFISLTNMTRNFGDENLIFSWMRNRNTVEFLGIWEQMNNRDFKGGEFETFKMEAGLNSFHLTPRKWVEATGAIGIQSRAGRYGGGTYAHKDLAFEFGSWLSPTFKLYLIKEFQRLKDEESRRLSLAWDLNRTLSKLNYRIHTDAIKDHLIPAAVTAAQAAVVYASEADLLNVALFGQTAKQWREGGILEDGNLRDSASVEQLLVLANLEAMNAEFIRMGISQGERLMQLNQIAIRQMQALAGAPGIKEISLMRHPQT